MSTGRYAPAPANRMHLGNLMCCLLAWLSAKSKAGGCCCVRIWTQRCPAAMRDAIVDDLAWLGLAADGPTPPVYQSDRSEIYQRYFDELSRRGLVYLLLQPQSAARGQCAPPQRRAGHLRRDLSRPDARQIAERSKIRARLARAGADEVIAFEDGHGAMKKPRPRLRGFFLRRADGVFATSWPSLWTTR